MPGAGWVGGRTDGYDGRDVTCIYLYIIIHNNNNIIILAYAAVVAAVATVAVFEQNTRMPKHTSQWPSTTNRIIFSTRKYAVRPSTLVTVRPLIVTALIYYIITDNKVKNIPHKKLKFFFYVSRRYIQ